MGIEESIAKILANQSELLNQINELRKSVENQNAIRILMRVPEVLKELGISQKTIIQYEKESLLKSYRIKPGSYKYYKRDEVFSFLNSEHPKAVRMRNKQR